MNSTFLLIMIAIVMFMLLNNMRKAKELKKDGGYVDAYMKVLKGDEDATDNLNAYISKGTDPSTKNRALIVKAYTDVLNGLDTKATIDEINFDEVFLVNGAYVKEKLIKISDSFVWLVLLLSKLKDDNKQLMDELYNKIYKAEFENHVEFNVFKCAYEIFSDKEEKDYNFLKVLLAGEYGSYIYDKALIGVFKKFAAALLIYAGEELPEEDEMMLKDFAATQVGNKLLGNLNLLDKYLEKKEEETVEEKTEEEVKEILEEIKEEENKEE